MVHRTKWKWSPWQANTQLISSTTCALTSHARRSKGTGHWWLTHQVDAMAPRTSSCLKRVRGSQLLDSQGQCLCFFQSVSISGQVCICPLMQKNLKVSIFLDNHMTKICLTQGKCVRTDQCLSSQVCICLLVLSCAILEVGIFLKNAWPSSFEVCLVVACSEPYLFSLVSIWPSLNLQGKSSRQVNLEFVFLCLESSESNYDQKESVEIWVHKKEHTHLMMTLMKGWYMLYSCRPNYCTFQTIP